MKQKRFSLTINLTLMFMALYLLLLPFIHYPLTTFLKPIPIFLLMLFVWQAQISKSRLLLTALGFSLLGDVVLTLPMKGGLEAGILAFMGAHLSYIGLFLKDWKLQRQRVIYFLPVLLFVIGAFIYLWPFFGVMQKPVSVYLCLITLMVFCAFQVKQNALTIIPGAILFLLSDFILSLDLFVLSMPVLLGIFIMLFYYLAQLLLVKGLVQSFRSAPI